MKKVHKQEVIRSITLLLYWTIPMIFCGKQRKLVMQYSYVEWSKARLLASLKQKKSTGSKEQYWWPKIQKTRSDVSEKMRNQYHPYISMTTLVVSANTMKQKGCFIDIFAVLFCPGWQGQNP